MHTSSYYGQVKGGREDTMGVGERGGVGFLWWLLFVYLVDNHFGIRNFVYKARVFVLFGRVCGLHFVVY